MARDPYLELGVSRGASADEIRKAFRKLAKENHPDTNPGNAAAEERFKKVSAAFDIVGDATKRKKFDAGDIDADGRDVPRGFGGGFGGGQGNPFGGGARGREAEGFEHADLSDLFGEILGRRGGGGAGGGQGGGFGGFSQRGADVLSLIHI